MFLLDTNVISELRKLKVGKANPKVVAWASNVSISQFFLSAVTVLELERGILILEQRDPSQAQVLRQWLSLSVLENFRGRILPFDTAVAQRCAQLHVPNSRPYLDSMIAATALLHGMTVVTRNISDFEGMDVMLLNPWE